ncbi:hypothetical protein PV735_15360 [Streptomyces turgidiscabies]|uniref:Uncharacterized protein n=1 Tax=Streptomyces turgidiscabies (strain Car8) TaxID=698760 RepID=L7FD22_STRT8|nr:MULTISPECIES: hypothetical protein [Streptomyces]ELP68530.1 hypothetical protein STRTUCAR8_03606 [Streptomyces turgidiscabies Car8]MDX3494056.1 hypothetical protein [Streptomyces turgidiscabies]GAQ68574.1 hypothetical protein T45_00285 [Streptomyces turgidiscabies]
MTSPPDPQWWVIYHEPTPAEMAITAVEPPPGDDAAHDKRCAELEASGQCAYVVAAIDQDAAAEIAGRIWAEELVANPARHATAEAYLAANRRPN